MSRSVAVMQPYLYPYPGYFRLMAAVDCFVILDCVQFNRRGRVHRMEVPGTTAGSGWLTLPLRRQAREVLIRDLAFADDARTRLDERLRPLGPVLAAPGDAAAAVRRQFHGPLGGVVDFLEDGLRLVASLLDLRPRILRSSSLAIDPGVKGQERILSIVQAVGGSRYVNAPGGRHLYDAPAFARAGAPLSFLAPYHGRYPFLLPALLGDGPSAVREDVLATTKLVTP